jgi:hypothetical protein
MTKRKRILRRALVRRLKECGIENHGLAHTEVGYLLNRCPESVVAAAILNCPKSNPITWLRDHLQVPA